MKIWKLGVEADDFDIITTEEKWDLDYINSFDGHKKAQDWTPINLKSVYPEQKRELGDTIGFYSHIPIFSEFAVKILAPLIGDSVEFLPANYEGKVLFLVNVINVMSCIDYEKAEFKAFSSGRVMRFTKYAFIKEKLQNEHIFKLSEFPLKRAYVSDTFKSVVEKANLRGYEFSLVWDDEQEA